MNTVHEDLLKLRREIAYLKEYIEDITLTKDDIDSLEEADRDLRQKKTKRF